MAELGTRAFVVLGSRTLAAGGLAGRLANALGGHGVEAVELATISHEPEVADVDEAVRRLAAELVRPGDLLLAVGGGSAIDLAKAVAALATNAEGRSVLDYLEGVGLGLKITAPPLPIVAVPTTAGTGSEATKNAVISSYDPPFKKSLRSDLMVPRAVIVDPELTVSLSPATTAATGMDAITQLIESYISRRAQSVVPIAGGRRVAAGAAARSKKRSRSAHHGRRARRWPRRRWSRAWRWPTPAWAWPTAWPRRWAYTCGWRTAWRVP